MIGSIERKEDSSTLTLISFEYVEELEKENKELNEHLDSVVEFYETELENKYKSILTELEEWLKEEGNNGIDEWGNHYSVCLYKLNMLKEKYK